MNEKFSSCNNRDVAITWTISESIGGVSVSKSCLTLATPWTVGCQAPWSMGFSRQNYWSGLPFLSPFLYIYLSAYPMCEVSREYFKKQG